MYDQMFEGLWKSMESSLQMQQDLMKGFAQQWMSVPTSMAGASVDRGRNVQGYWIDAGIDLLDRHRQSLDTTYRAGIAALKQAIHMPEAKNPDEYRESVEGMWRKAVETLKQQSESQFREFEKWTERSFQFMRQDGQH